MSDEAIDKVKATSEHEHIIGMGDEVCQVPGCNYREVEVEPDDEVLQGATSDDPSVPTGERNPGSDALQFALLGSEFREITGDQVARALNHFAEEVLEADDPEKRLAAVADIAVVGLANALSHPKAAKNIRERIVAYLTALGEPPL